MLINRVLATVIAPHGNFLSTTNCIYSDSKLIFVTISNCENNFLPRPINLCRNVKFFRLFSIFYMIQFSD